MTSYKIIHKPSTLDNIYVLCLRHKLMTANPAKQFDVTYLAVSRNLLNLFECRAH